MIAGYALVAIALIAQISFPWLKAWHDSGARDAGNTRIALEQIVGDRIGEPAPAHDSHDAECPVCRLISQSRHARLLSVFQVTALFAVEHALAHGSVATPRGGAHPTCAARAPPTFLV